MDPCVHASMRLILIAVDAKPIRVLLYVPLNVHYKNSRTPVHFSDALERYWHLTDRILPSLFTYSRMQRTRSIMIRLLDPSNMRSIVSVPLKHRNNAGPDFVLEMCPACIVMHD